MSKIACVVSNSFPELTSNEYVFREVDQHTDGIENPKEGETVEKRYPREGYVRAWIVTDEVEGRVGVVWPVPQPKIECNYCGEKPEPDKGSSLFALEFSFIP